jgi:hypothetical protein
MDAELRERFQAELHQIRDWLDDFIEDELQGSPRNGMNYLLTPGHL